VFFLDRLLIGSLGFVFDKLAQVADQELNDTEKLREKLLDAQMRYELGELPEDEYLAIQEAVMARLREVEERKRAESGGGGGAGAIPPDAKVTGVEITFGGDDDDAR
jgi:hypothetical protein